MTLAQFIAQFRKDRDDAAAPYLWSTVEIRTYLNEALNEACERALLIEDSTSAQCCLITLINGQDTYTLDPSVIKVKRVSYDGLKIAETSVEKLDHDDLAWETRSGAPRQYVLTNQSSIRITPAPTTATIATAPTLGLTVYRTPLITIDEDTDDETDLSTLVLIPKIYHMRLLPWMYRLALQKTDSQTIDMDDSDRQEKIFTANFGERPDANMHTKRRDKRRPIVRCAW